MSTRPRRPLPQSSLLSMAIAGLLLAPVARGATISVTSTADDGTGCTLREAIASINLGSLQGDCTASGPGVNDTIGFTVIGTITLTHGQLEITKSMIIDGPGADQLAVDGNAASRVFNIPGGAPRNVTIEGLTIQNGSVDGGGGGIYLGSSVSLALTNSTVSGNSAGYGGGGVYASYENTVTLTNSTVSGNSTGDSGGGVSAWQDNILTLTNSTVSGNSAGEKGGGVFARGYNTLTLTNSTVSGNSAADGGGVYAQEYNALTLTHSTVSGNSAGSGGGVYASYENSLTLTNSTVSDNSAGDDGGGVYARRGNTLTLTNSTVSGNSAGYDGGGVSARKYNTLTLINSTVSGNSAGDDGGGVSAQKYNTLTLTNSTVSGNSAGDDGGGVYAYDENTLTLTNSILANSTGGDCVAHPSTVTGTFNLIESTGVNACGLINGVDGNIIGDDPLLGPLADNGCVIPSGVPGSPDYGCVQTHALLDGSPALNAANAAVCAADPVKAIDERGAARPQGGGCDIGAFERGWPGAPTQVTVSPGVERVTVSWTPPVDPGLGALRSCTATAEPGGASCTGLAVSNQCTLTGLTPGTTYTVSVVCTNDAGISGFTSATSEPVSPLPPSVPAVSAAGLLGGAGLLGLLGAWRLRRQARRRGR